MTTTSGPLDLEARLLRRSETIHKASRSPTGHLVGQGNTLDDPALLREAAAEIRSLRGALKPFDIHWIDHRVLSDELVIKIAVTGTSFEDEITVGDFRRARAALKEGHSS